MRAQVRSKLEEFKGENESNAGGVCWELSRIWILWWKQGAEKLLVDKGSNVIFTVADE